MTFRPYDAAVEPTRLCSQCATYGFSTLLQLLRETEDDAVDCTLDARSSWDLKNCQLCHFISQCLPLPIAQPPEVTHGEIVKLVSRSRDEIAEDLGVVARILNYGELEKRSLTLECYRSASERKPSQSLVALLRDGQWPDIKPTSPMVDFTLLAGWLKGPTSDLSSAPARRKASGSNRSTRSKPSRTGSWAAAQLRVLEMELNVIDCTTRHIVELPNGSQYVTLSYVWGKSSGGIRRGTPRRPDSMLGSLRLAGTSMNEDQDRSSRLPSKFPLTIEDSISVCKALDYRYLWVDRYCIPQKDQQLRARQIQQMDDIYCGSALTLIASAGLGPQYGLPGVSRSRAACPAIRTGASEYLQMIPTVQDIHSSTWATRAWTYQEALLAQRRFFFTDRQVYFESSDMVESELTTLAPVVTRVLDPRIYSQVTSSTFPVDIYKCIQAYTHRKLSFQSDVLNAMFGILTYYGREHDIRHLWGVPFSANTPASIDEPPRKHIITFEESLCWYPSGEHSRREGFPSWSWAGWMTTVTWDIWRHDLKPASAPLKQGQVSVELELNSGDLLRWSDYQAKYAELNESSSQDQLSRFLHIETYVSRLIYTQNPTDGSDTGGCSTMGLEVADVEKPVTLDLFSNPARTADNLAHFLAGPAESYLALHLSNWQEDSGTILVVQEKGGYWERVALMDDETEILQRAVKRWTKVRLG
ncbi:hypothetical protein HBI82_128910 [Parastagonospora nodorum]|nr:hypothetical protein HBI20_180930 [Parastagonospora nodorum]KAH6010427.1 hypothetical protein HBI82_128910 [Parastagonospora nodorum]